MKILVTGGSGLVGNYVVDELSKFHSVENLDIMPFHRNNVAFHNINLLNFNSVVATVKEYDVVVHLAGIPHPLNDPAEKVFRTNTNCTFNLLEACAINGISRFIFISSESTLGFAFASSPKWPEYVPIDEKHPLQPEDPYGLSKVACELLCQGYTRRVGMQTICLRPPWIWVPAPKEIQFYAQLIKEYPKWYKNLWAYVHVFDVAKAIRLCVESKNLPLHDAYFICADENWTGRESRTLLAEFYPGTNTIANDFKGRDSFLSNKKAQKAFGFKPQYSWRDIISQQ